MMKDEKLLVSLDIEKYLGFQVVSPYQISLPLVLTLFQVVVVVVVLLLLLHIHYLILLPQPLHEFESLEQKTHLDSYLF